jgi:hypothetical protein
MRGALHQMVERGFRRPIGALIRHTHRTGNRSHEGERPTAISGECPARNLDHKKGMPKHDVELPVPRCVVELSQWQGISHPDNVDGTCEMPAELCVGLRENVLYVGAPGDVGRDSGSADFPRHPLREPEVTIYAKHLRTTLCQRMSGLAPHAVSGAQDDITAAVQS